MATEKQVGNAERKKPLWDKHQTKRQRDARAPLARGTPDRSWIAEMLTVGTFFTLFSSYF